MKLLIVSQVFWPENFRINDLCTELVKLGHEVSVITGKPNYPKGKFYKGYGLFSKIKSDYNGATVYRIPIIPRGSASGLSLSINYLSFAFFASIFAFFHRKKYDFSFVFAVSPITSALPAIVHRAVYGTKHYLWVLDLWPEGVEVTGKLKSKFLKKQLYSLVKFIYRKSDKIYVSSRFMENSIVEKLPTNHKKEIIYLPNWAEDHFVSENVDKTKYASLIPKGFIIMFAGNIGFGQDCPSIIKAAQLLQAEKNVKFVLLGDGSEKQYMEQQVKELGLENTVYFLGSYPIEEMPHFYCHADMMLLTLRGGSIYNYTVPGKLQSYLASKKPIVAMINGETKEIIEKSKSGIVVNAEEYKLFAEKIAEVAKKPKSIFEEMGQNGYEYYFKTFTKKIVITTLLDSVKN